MKVNLDGWNRKMTRYEAKEKAFKCEGFHSGVNYQEHLTDGIWLLRSDVLNFIDKIYDEFENRICGSCIQWHSKKVDHPNWREGNQKDSPYMYADTHYSFGCRKWEAK